MPLLFPAPPAPSPQLLDGAFSPDGRWVLVSDVAGQFHVYGPPGDWDALARAPYDQFFSADFNSMTHDTNE